MKKIIFLILALLIMVGSTILATKTVTNDDHQHTISAVAEVAPNCTEAGTKAYYKCAICEKLFSDEEGKNEIEAPETVAALGHTEVIDAPISATCTSEGKTEGKHCSVCNLEIVKQEATTKLEHTYNQEKAESKYLASEATCTAKATYYKSCSCGEKGTETFESGEKLDLGKGHTYEWTVTTSPDYENAGVATSGVYCTTCRLYREAQTEVLPAVSEENGYEKISVNSLYTTWAYALEDGTVVNVDVYNPSETYTFMSNVAGKDPFATTNGGSFVLHADYATQTGWDTGNKSYNNTYGGTFTISLNVEVATTIDLYFVLNNPKADTSVFKTFTNVLLDGTDITSTALVDSSMPMTAGWAVSQQQSVLIATIELHEGVNEITVVRSIADKNGQGYNNINIRGIEVASTVPVELGGTEEKEYTFIKTRTDDLFLEANGGSVSVGNYSASYGWQQTFGSSISFQIYSEKATTVQFYMIISGNKGATTVKEAFTEMSHTANGVTNKVDLIDTAMSKTDGWSFANANTVLIAEIELQAGVNEFTIVRNPDTNSEVGTNINIWGVEFVSDSELSVVNS